MDFTGIIGFIIGIVLVGYGILDGGKFSTFIDYPSMAITFGGTIASALIAFPISTFKDMPKHFKIANQKQRYDPKKYISKIVEFAQEARRKGLLSLEDKANQEDDQFLKESVMLIVDAIDPEKVKEMLDNELNGLEQRHSRAWQVYEKISGFAPAFGMIGTLIGLTNMLANMDMDAEGGVKKLANGMSVAIITTFYGAMLANLVLIPFAHKLHMRHNEEMLCKEIVVEGVIAIQAGDNPKHIEERLNAFLCEKSRASDSNNSFDSARDEKKTRRRR